MNRLHSRLFHFLLLAIVLFLALSSVVYAQVNYQLTGTLNLTSGKDPLGLSGQTVTATTSISQSASPSNTSTSGSSSSNTYSGPTVSLTLSALGNLKCAASPAATVTLTDNVGAADTISINCSVATLATIVAAVTLPDGNMITAVPASIPSTGVTGTVTATLTGGSPTVFGLTNATIVASGTQPPTVTPSLSSWTPSAQQGSTTPLTQAITFTTSVPSAAVSFKTSTTGGAWLTVSPSAANSSSTVTITANPSGLAAGGYNGTVFLNYGNSGVSPTQISVILTVAGGAVSLTPAPTSMTFNFTPGSSSPSPQTLTISAASATAVSAAVTSGNSWLSVSPGSGTTPAAFQVSVNTSGITSGPLSGNIQITASGSSPVNVPVTLNVSSTVLTVPTTLLTFNYTVGGATPAAQSVSISGTAGIAFTTSTSGVAWLSASPAAGTVPATVSVSINAAGLSSLAAGQYSGSVIVTSTGAGGSPAAIPVTLNVTAPSLTVAPSKLSFSYQIGSSTQPAAQTITIGDTSNLNFTATAATSLGGPWLSVSPGFGNASGTFTVSVNTKGLTANVLSGTITIASAGTASQVVDVTLQSIEPAVSGIVSAASYENTAFSPGTIVTIFGTLLGPQTGAVFDVNSNGSINANLGGTTVTVEGIPAIPLFAQNGQVNIILPYGISTSGQAYVEVKYDNATSVQFNIPLTPAAVQIFTADASGSGPGSILNQDFSVNTVANPAAKGSVVSIFGTGGGAVKPAVTAGTIAGNTLSWVTLPYSATVNGENAKVMYAGSAPGLVYGVYQFNVQLPSDLPSGADKIVLKVGSSSSQSDVTVFVQ